MRSNPRAVFRGGDLILVGDMLDLPIIRVPEAGLTAATTPEATTVTCGGECPAVQPREICTEYGNFRIYPDDFAGDLPTSPDDAQNVRESECEALVAEREREANAQAERTVGEVDSLPLLRRHRLGDHRPGGALGARQARGAPDAAAPDHHRPGQREAPYGEPAVGHLRHRGLLQGRDRAGT